MDAERLKELLDAETGFRFLIHGQPTSPRMAKFVERFAELLKEEGAEEADRTEESPRLAINLTHPEAPQPYRRQSKAVFVATIMEGAPVDDPLKGCYALLVRTLSNFLIYLEAPERDGEFRAHCLTPERGYFSVQVEEDAWHPGIADLARRFLPIASSHLVIDNEFHLDLPEALWQGDEHTALFLDVGRRLDQLNLLPAPFDLNELLPESDLRHLKRLYSIGGLSYGNMSQRRDATSFWMSANGVDKSRLVDIGRDILLVKGFSFEKMCMLLSVPPHVTPRRVSVDAIEHFMIYSEHPEVGAILHVHAWMEGIESTEISYPCGSIELAIAVADVVRKAEDPSRCVVGLKNHGLTITGKNLKEILDRVEDRLLVQIPMD